MKKIMKILGIIIRIIVVIGLIIAIFKGQLSLSIFPIMLFVLIMLLVVLSIKACSTDEYIAVFRFGRCLGVSSGSLVIIMPFIDRAIRIQQGEQGTLLDADTVNIKGFLIPIMTENDIPIGSTVKVAGSENVPDTRQFMRGCKLRVVNDIA